MIKLIPILKQILREQDELNLDDKDQQEQPHTDLDTSDDNQEEPELKPIDPTAGGVIDPNSPLEPQTNEPEDNVGITDISTIDAKNLIEASKGKMFTATFIKKDGTIRVLNGRLGVKAYLKGGTLPYNPEEKGLIPVFDVQKGYRMINWTTIKKLKIGGREYNVK